MSDRTQDLTNHRKVAVACKNYTDTQIAQAKEEIYWHIGEYSVTTSNDNTSASVKTVPSNATRCKIKRVYGNTQKLNPTTASDSTSAMMKTMPSTVYDFDVSKVEGKSEKSENLLVLSDVAETTTNGITWKIENGVIYIKGEATTSANVTISILTGLNLTGSFNIFSSYNSYIFFYLNNSGTYNTFNASTASNITMTKLELEIPGYGDQNPFNQTNYITLKPMLVTGSTAPTEFKVGYTGIHNLAWNGVKVEGSNLLDLTQGTNGYINDSGEIVVRAMQFASDYIEVKGGQTYIVKTSQNFHNIGIAYYDSNKNIILPRTDNQNSSQVTITSSVNGYIRIWFNVDNTTSINSSIETTYSIRLNLGSTALPYTPYITPTIIPIDLSTILYNGNPLFEENALKGVGTAKDYITPYVAHKEVGTRAYQSGDEEDSDVLTDGTTTLYPLATPIEVSINWASTLRGITGYSNGTITLLNTYNMDSANTITYNSIIKENCCAKMVQTRGGSVIKTINFPTQASDGWSAGSVSNVRDFTNNTRTPYVDKVDLGTLDYSYSESNLRFTTSDLTDFKRPATTTEIANAICSIYTIDTTYNGNLGTNNMTLSLGSNGVLYVVNHNFTDATVFKNAMSGTYLYYEKATSTSSSITAIENVIEVEAGDTLAFYDSEDNLVTVPSDLTYRIEVAN